MAANPPVVGASERSAIFPPGLDPIAFASLLIGFALLYLPSYWDLSHTVWAADEQGHGPIILAVSFWLLYRKRHELLSLQVARTAPLAGAAALLFGLLLYVLGRSQAIQMFEVGSQIAVIGALVLLFRGWAGLRLVWFPLFFLLFMVPLPEALVAAVTGPLKSAVSAVASNLLFALGYPVGRAGVVLTVGPFQLLVADACAGLNSMFTLEALGMLYMNLMNYKSALRNTILAVVLVPIAFCANIVRVMILVLVTYHFGDEAGQGFVHGFAGMVLFFVGLAFMLLTDKLLSLVFHDNRRRAA